MELKAELKKPYKEIQRLHFISENNHINKYEIRETDTALEAWGYTEEEKKRRYYDNLTLSPCDVELALYRDKGIDFEDLKGLIKEKAPEIDIKTIGIELKRGIFERQNKYVKQIGALLGYSDDDIDYLFEHKKLPKKEEKK